MWRSTQEDGERDDNLFQTKKKYLPRLGNQKQKTSKNGGKGKKKWGNPTVALNGGGWGKPSARQTKEGKS